MSDESQALHLTVRLLLAIALVHTIAIACLILNLYIQDRRIERVRSDYVHARDLR